MKVGMMLDDFTTHVIIQMSFVDNAQPRTSRAQLMKVLNSILHPGLAASGLPFRV